MITVTIEHQLEQYCGKNDSVGNMFYVVYNPVTKQFLSNKGDFGGYDDAKQFGDQDDAEWRINEIESEGLRVVGPCIEGEEP